MYSVMIVDDEYLERKAIRAMVEKNMPRLEVVGEGQNGDEAVELAVDLQPHIILMDIKMPGRSGLEAAREITEHYPDTRIIILTAFDYFEYAHQALHIGIVDYLLKPVRPSALQKVLDACVSDLDAKIKMLDENKKIRKQLSKMWPYIQSSFIFDLINGNIVEEQELKQSASILDLDLFPSVVMVIGVEKPETATRSLPGLQHQLNRQKVFEVAQDVFNDCASVLITPVLEDKIVLLLPCNNKDNIEAQYNFYHRKAEKILRRLSGSDISVSIGVGRFYEDIFMIRRSYLEALENQQASSFAGENEIVSCLNCDSAAQCQQFCKYQDLNESELVYLICAGDWEGVTKLLDPLWDAICKSNAGEELQKALVLELLVVIYRAVMSGPDKMAIFGLSYIKELLDSDTIDQLGEGFYAAVKEMMETVKKNDKVTSSMVKAVQNYINDNYPHEVSLKDAARHVHVSPCYLSRIFSKQVGLPFKKYLIDVRLNSAKKLLLTTNKPVGEIAFDVGYNDVSYFCRTFKQHQGLSPNNYRANNAYNNA